MNNFEQTVHLFNLEELTNDQYQDVISTCAIELVNFSDWCDANGHCELLVKAEAYKSALDEFSLYLDSQVRSQNGIGTVTANRMQSQAIKSAYVIFPGSPLNSLSDRTMISHSSPNKEAIETPYKT